MDVERPVSYIVKFELDDHGSRRKAKTRGPYLWHLTERNTETPIKVNEPLQSTGAGRPMAMDQLGLTLGLVMKLFINRHADDHEYIHHEEEQASMETCNYVSGDSETDD